MSIAKHAVGTQLRFGWPDPVRQMPNLIEPECKVGNRPDLHIWWDWVSIDDVFEMRHCGLCGREEIREM